MGGLLYLVLALFLVVLSSSIQLDEPEPSEDEIHYQLCGYLKKDGMLRRMKLCYEKEIPDRIKSINGNCKTLVGQGEITDEAFWMKNCEKSHSEIFLEFENCTSREFLKKKITDEEAEYLMGPFIECLLP